MTRISGKEFLKLNARLGPMWFLRGVNYWRYVEYPWVVNNLSITKEQKILDVGSSSCSLLPLLLASKRQYLIFVTDLDDHVLRHVKLVLERRSVQVILILRFIVICTASILHMNILRHSGRYINLA